MIIKAKSFVLRPYKKGDEKSLVKNINDWKVSRFMSTVPYPYKREDAVKWVDNCIKMPKTRNKRDVILAMDAKGEVIGTIALHNIKKQEAEMGYWLAKRLWNKGIMTKAIRIMTDYGFKELGLKRIYAPIFSKNKVSARVLEKNGYRKGGLLRKYACKNGKTIDCYMYTKIK